MANEDEQNGDVAIGDPLPVSLDALVGTWRSEGRFVDDEQDGETWSGWDIYEWFPGHRHMVHRVDVTIGGERNEALELFSPRVGSPHAFDQTSFNADGTVEHATGSFDAEGRYHNDAGDARAVVTFGSPSVMQALWDKRQPDQRWMPWMEVTFTRIGDPHVEVRSKTDHTP